MVCKHLMKRRIINLEDLKEFPTPILFHIGKDDRSDYKNELNQYAKEAIYIGFNSLYGPQETHGGTHPLPDMNEFAKKMMRIGLNPGSIVVIYSPVDIVYAARFWWMLKTIGIIGYVIYDASEIKNYEYKLPKIINYETLVFDPSQTAEYREIRDHLKDPDYYLIDSRNNDCYCGEESGCPPFEGHIPGAHHHFSRELINNGIPDYPDINPEFRLEYEKNIILYCHCGISATLNALLLESITIPYRIYVGGFSDWITHEDMILEK